MPKWASRPGLAAAALVASAALACPTGAIGADAATPQPAAGAAPAADTSGAANTDPCQPPPVGSASATAPIVRLDDNTLWRPRNGEVRFKVISPGKTAIPIKSVTVCFGWSAAIPKTAKAVPAAPAADDSANQDSAEFHMQHASPLVRSIVVDGGVEYGAVVPDLPAVEPSWPRRLMGYGHTATVGFDTVPLADMLVKIDQTGSAADVVTVRVPVGVTSVSFSVAIAVVAIAIFFGVAWLFLRRSLTPHASLLLRIVSSRDHVASLSQFQIVLWTLVVGASAVYVMALSGNLIGITDGTLSLLGIAGGAAVLGRIPGKPASPAAGSNPADPGGGGAEGPDIAGSKGSEAAGSSAIVTSGAIVSSGGVIVSSGATVTSSESVITAGGGGAVLPPAAGNVPDDSTTVNPLTRPHWSDLVVVNGEIDVTRIQMLVFTVITAAFVALNVVVSYEIPEIPSNFLLLMGISNGVYLTGKHIPDNGRTAP